MCLFKMNKILDLLHVWRQPHNHEAIAVEHPLLRFGGLLQLQLCISKTSGKLMKFLPSQCLT